MNFIWKGGLGLLIAVSEFHRKQGCHIFIQAKFTSHKNNKTKGLYALLSYNKMDEPSYKPNDILGPWKCSSSLFPYDGAFGNRSWELVAAHIVSLSQRKGEWVGVKDFHPDYDTKGMIKAGLLKGVYKKIEWPDSLEGKKIGVMLTEEAIERLVQYTDPMQSAYVGRCYDEISNEITSKSEDNILSREPSAHPSDCSSSRQKAELAAL